MEGRRRLASLVVALVVVVAVPACSKDAPATYRIGVLRAVAGIDSEQVLFDGLDAGGIARARVKVVGGADLAEVHATVADAEATVRRWVRDGVDAIVALSTTTAQAAAEAAPHTPVLVLTIDPEAAGLIRSERHPEGHLTGVTYRVPPDRILALVSDAYPTARHVGCVYPPADPAAVPAQAKLGAPRPRSG